MLSAILNVQTKHGSEAMDSVFDYPLPALRGTHDINKTEWQVTRSYFYLIAFLRELLTRAAQSKAVLSV